MKTLKLTTEDVAQAGLDAEIAANLKALGMSDASARRMSDVVFDALVKFCRDQKRPPTIMALATICGYSRKQVGNALNHLAYSGRIISVGAKSGVYIPRVVKPARVR